jgi:hypothetical protein
MKAILGPRRLLLLACAAAALALPSCEWDGNFTVLGYTTKPNYDCGIRTVRVPIFENRSFRQGIEFDLTRAVVREINLKTPYHVVGCDHAADTELTGVIRSFTKSILSENQLNEVREAETNLVVELVWRDLRTGQVLSVQGSRPFEPVTPALPVLPGAGPVALAPGVVAPGAASAPTPPGSPSAGPTPPDTPLTPTAPGAPPARPGPITVVASTADFIPELGESISTAQQRNVDRLAVQIVSMMEKPWNTNGRP